MSAVESEEITRAATGLTKAIENVHQARQEFLQGAIPQLEPALNDYLRTVVPKAKSLAGAREVAKSVGGILRDLHLAIRGKGSDRDMPCTLIVDYDADYPDVPRLRLRLDSPGDHAGHPRKRFSDIKGRTFSYTLSSILPLELMPASLPLPKLLRWADRAASKERGDRENGPAR